MRKLILFKIKFDHHDKAYNPIGLKLCDDTARHRFWVMVMVKDGPFFFSLSFCVHVIFPYECKPVRECSVKTVLVLMTKVNFGHLLIVGVFDPLTHAV